MIARLLACRSGAVGVEAAIVFPVLIALVLGMVEFGLLLFTYSSMQTATREVARRVAVNFIAPADAEAEVRGRLPQWSAPAADVTVTQSAPGNPGVNVVRVAVAMPASEATPILFFMRAAEDWNLRTEVAMKQELPL